MNATVPLPKQLQRKKKDMDDEGYFPEQSHREAELFHTRADVTRQEPMPMAPMYDLRKPPTGPSPNNIPVNNGNAARKAFLDEMHEDRRPTHHSSLSAGRYNPAENPPSNTRPSSGSPPQPEFHNHNTPVHRDT
ncbi:hypothetical protein CVT24_008567 [Panaeolus cyanescens]|uniref:Uncharacterized protein n=1 Tax=Panaeolus cyanescens TaxID=181874 RepID=A0A409VB66_9AGAR|nr:hypothetical protein CVT24_008567 [Panaeolus cyanescens]